MPFPAVRQAQMRRAEYGRPPRDPVRLVEWVERYYRLPVYLDRKLPHGIYAHLVEHPEAGPMILISRWSPWPRWSICHETAHWDTGTLLPAEWWTEHWRVAGYERIANRYAVELAAPLCDVLMLFRRGLTVKQTARVLDVPIWVIERQAQATLPARGDEWLWTA